VTTSIPSLPAADYTFVCRQTGKLEDLINRAFEIKKDDGQVDETQLGDFFSRVPNYDCQNAHDVGVSIKQCICYFTKLESDGLVLKRIGGGGTKGISGAPVHFIFVKEQKQGIAKLLPNLSELPSELCSFRKIFELSSKIERLAVVSVIGVGDIQAPGKRYGLVIQSLAQGHPLDDLMIFRNHFSTPALLNAALKNVGYVLADLHVTTLSPRSPILYELESCCKSVKEVVGKIKRKIVDRGFPYLKPLKVEELEKFSDQVCTSYTKEPGYSSVVHLDAHVGNFFYDDRTSLVTMIDIAALSRSFLKNGTGVVSPARDYSYFLVKLPIFGLEKGMSEEQLNASSAAFKEGYEGGLKGRCDFSTIICKTADLFFAFRTQILFLQRYTEDISQIENAVSSSEYNMKYKIIEYMVEKIRQFLQKNVLAA
jgi:hypothetical protein